MKILFLAPRLPLPADTGGKIRTLNILKEVARNATVTLLSFSFDKEDELNALTLKDLGIKVFLIPMQRSSTFTKVVNTIFNWVPFSISKYDSVAMEKMVSKLIFENKFDAIHIDHLHMAHYIEKCPDIPCFLDEHNVEYKILERCIPVEKSLIKKLIFWDQAIKMKFFEKRILKKVRTCFACSSDDQIILTNLNKNKSFVSVVPNGVDTEFFNSHPDPTKMEDAIVFTGSMDWLPNDDAITYFCTEILPLIWKENPHIKLYVVGKSPSQAVRKLADNDKRVIVTGRVDDVRSYIERAKIFIVPLRIGGGTRLKILEAMSMRKAVISTTIGAEGIKYTEGSNIALADTPIDFAKKVLGMIPDPELIENMGNNGRTLVCELYDWKVVGKKLNSIYQEVIHGKIQ